MGSDQQLTGLYGVHITGGFFYPTDVISLAVCITLVPAAGAVVVLTSGKRILIPTGIEAPKMSST